MSISFTELLPHHVFSLDNVYSSEECDRLIEESEKQGYTVASIQLGAQKQAKAVIADEVRTNDSQVIDDPKFAQNLWDLTGSFFPQEFLTQEDGWKAVGIAPNLRFYRYKPGSRFIRHYDGYDLGSMRYSDKPSEGLQPFLSVLVYLNDGFEGGNTTFFTSKGKELLSVAPKKGTVLVYSHKMLHEGSTVTEGTKYVLRSDVLFSDPSKPPPSAGSSCILL
eukprot:TRINITY_DN19773_c0_g1_i1.p1 TRINITY_DN19773_c0_g1~~TRINITY_DN19773_c0_g1_i1.p1  ORF type:complete len:221 (-),score=17.01 TRINITY_DN19773_c0_g1_i1:346-1008(-)